MRFGRSFILMFLIPVFSKSQTDTINRLDKYECKHGYWKVLKEHKGVNYLAEDGYYADNHKIGTWTQYNSSGKIKSQLEFHNGRAHGRARLFYESGNLMESGTFNTNHWTGEYHSYYDDPNTLEKRFSYNEKGKREGCQFYYYKNGRLAEESYYANGVRDFSETYHENGNLSELFYRDSLKISFNDDGKKQNQKNYKTNTITYFNEDGSISKTFVFDKNAEYNYPFTTKSVPKPPVGRFASPSDSIFLSQVKRFFSKETGYNLTGNFYTSWKQNEEPYYLLYVSEPDSVSTATSYTYAGGVAYSYRYFNTKAEIENAEAAWNKKGYHPFIYTGYANSAAELSVRFLSYSREAQCFIIFHELMHNFVFQQKLNIPYHLHEALCDVIGNYGAIRYSKLFLNNDFSETCRNADLNERIYTCLNSYIPRIRKNASIRDLLTNCQKEMDTLMSEADLFQKDRFNYKVNNGFLLKNSNYCLNYFLLRGILTKQGSILKLIEVIRGLPDAQDMQIKYLESFL